MLFLSLREVLSGRITNEFYSHIPLIPGICIFLIFLRRREWMKLAIAGLFGPGLLLMLSGAVLFELSLSKVAVLGLVEPSSALGAVIFVIGSFQFLLGPKVVKIIRFPLALLFVIVPLPQLWTDRIIAVLSAGSVAAASWIFSSLGVPFVREGPLFLLPGFDIEITRLCSGMRSTIAMTLVSLVASHLFLKKIWKKTVLTTAAILISVLKNGFRAVILYILGYHIDQKVIMGGFLHNSGGFLFFLLGLSILGLLLETLRGAGEVTSPGQGTGHRFESDRIGAIE